MHFKPKGWLNGLEPSLFLHIIKVGICSLIYRTGKLPCKMYAVISLKPGQNMVGKVRIFDMCKNLEKTLIWCAWKTFNYLLTLSFLCWAKKRQWCYKTLFILVLDTLSGIKTDRGSVTHGLQIFKENAYLHVLNEKFTFLKIWAH